MGASQQLLLAAGDVWSAPKTLLAHTSAASSDGSNVTTAGIDTTGANLLIVHVGNYAGGTGIVSAIPTDSKANASWTPLTIHAGIVAGASSRIWYVANPTVGTGHTFSITAPSPNPNLTFPAICVAAFGGANGTLDVENGGSASSGAPTQAVGSITPALNGELIIAGICEFDAFVGAFAVDSGMTILDTRLYNAGTNLGSTLAYLIQSGKAAINPTWSWTSGGNKRAYSVAAFK